MKIGLIIYGSLDTLSGGYLYDRKLVETLRKQGSHVDIISLPWRNYLAHLTDNLFPQLDQFIMAQNYDLLLQDELNHPSLIGLNQRLKRRSSCPIVSIVHHLRIDEEHPAWIRPLYFQIEQAYLQSVDAFLLNSWTTRRAVESMLASPRPMHVAYPAGDHLKPPQADKIREQIKKQNNPSPLNLAFVGNVMERKCLHTVVESLAILNTIAPHVDIRLHAIGDLNHDPRYTRHIQAMIAEAGLQSRVKLYGRVSSEKLGELLQQCHVFALPSFEGFGIVYLEAMAYGLCPIASTRGAAHEIIHHGQNGLLVMPESPETLAGNLLQIIENPEHLKAMRLEALAHVGRFLKWQDSMDSAYLWLCELQARSAQDFSL